MATVSSRFFHYIGYLAFVPTAIFLATMQYHDARLPDRWAYAFYYAALPALMMSACALAVFPRSDKLWLGANLWFTLLGSLTAAKAWGPLELLASTFKESGGFVITAAMGVIAGMVAPGSFLGAGRSTSAVLRAWILTGVACAVATLSYLAQGDRLLSIMLPVVIFLAAAFALRRRLRTKGDA